MLQLPSLVGQSWSVAEYEISCLHDDFVQGGRGRYVLMRISMYFSYMHSETAFSPNCCVFFRCPFDDLVFVTNQLALLPAVRYMIQVPLKYLLGHNDDPDLLQRKIIAQLEMLLDNLPGEQRLRFQRYLPNPSKHIGSVQPAVSLQRSSIGCAFLNHAARNSLFSPCDLWEFFSLNFQSCRFAFRVRIPELALFFIFTKFQCRGLVISLIAIDKLKDLLNSHPPLTFSLRRLPHLRPWAPLHVYRALRSLGTRSLPPSSGGERQ